MAGNLAVPVRTGLQGRLWHAHQGRCGRSSRRSDARETGKGRMMPRSEGLIKHERTDLPGCMRNATKTRGWVPLDVWRCLAPAAPARSRPCASLPTRLACGHALQEPALPAPCFVQRAQPCRHAAQPLAVTPARPRGVTVHSRGCPRPPQASRAAQAPTPG